MRDWKQYWNFAPQVFDPDPLKQVGKAVKGVPISSAQLEAIVHDVSSGLSLQPNDALLDLCCGNGLLTCALARRCASVVGVDFSGPLLTRARSGAPGNVEFVLADVCELPADLRARLFSKIALYEGLQHLDERQTAQLFRQLRAFEAEIFLGSIPDRERLDRFYDSPERRAEYEARLAAGTEAIGTWWARDTLASLAAADDLSIRFVPQSPSLHSHHYRFDVVLSPGATR